MANVNFWAGTCRSGCAGGALPDGLGWKTDWFTTPHGALCLNLLFLIVKIAFLCLTGAYVLRDVHTTTADAQLHRQNSTMPYSL